MSTQDNAEKLAAEILPEVQQIMDAMSVLFHGFDMLAVGYALLSLHAQWIAKHCAETGHDTEEVLAGAVEAMRRQINDSQ